MLTDSLVNLAVFHSKEDTSHSEVMVFAALSSLAMCETINPSIAWLEAKTRFSRTTVKKALASLEDRGCVQITHVERDGITQTNRYLLVWDAYLNEEGMGIYRTIVGALPDGHRLAHTPPGGEDATKEEAPASRPKQPTEASRATTEIKQLCLEIADSVERRTGIRPKITESWLKQARLTMEQDKIPYTEATRALLWAEKDSFWCKNVLSPNSLRKYMTRLLAGANNTGTTSMFLKELAASTPIEEDPWQVPPQLALPSTPF